ncbi:MAG TPA: DUF1931 family protein [Flavobacteriales bacterium]|nr:DUF1931 family protein [Flavobacteriales bacterium]
MSVIGVSKFESFFRKAGSLDIDKSDVKRIYDFTNEVIYRLLTVGMKNAKLNGRDVLWYTDLPITEGLEAQIEEFRQLNEELDLEGILEAITKMPPLALAIGEDVEQELPNIAGGILVALIKTFKILEPKLKNPQTKHWESAKAIFETLL